jgi:NADH-quinone oxidoreductase subunit M
MTSFPLLSLLVFLPALSAAALLLFPAGRKREIRVFALAAAGLTLALSIAACFSFDLHAGGYQWEEAIPWIPRWGIGYHVGVNGISLPLVLLTGIVMFTGVLVSWGIDDRPREFFAFLFLLATGVFGVFVSLDLFQLFFFYEIAVFPMFLLIALWGWPKTREYAAMKLTLYLFIGSMVALVGALVLVFSAGSPTFDLTALEAAAFPVDLQRIVFPFVFLGFAVLGGLFPFHNWSPDGHVAAPTAVSMFHAGVLMKLGAFAALRVGIMLMPEGAKFHMPWILVLALVNVLYGAFIAMVQTDFKYVIGFSSVSHMGLVMLGFASLTREGILGASLQMFSHGAMTALFFAVVGIVYDRTHTREISALGGLAQAAAGGAGLRHRRAGLDGHAGLFRIHRRIPDLPRRLAGVSGGGGRGGFGDPRHRGLHSADRPAGFLRRDFRRTRARRRPDHRQRIDCARHSDAGPGRDGRVSGLDLDRCGKRHPADHEDIGELT